MSDEMKVLTMTIAKLEMHPDDVLVVRLNERYADQDRVMKIMKDALPPGRKVLIVNPGTEFLILRQVDKSDPLAGDKTIIRPELIAR